MELKIYWLQLAEDKLSDIYQYHKFVASKGTALKLVNGIIECTIPLKKLPEIGQIEELLAHRKEKFRYLVYKNYKIVYWINYDFQRVEIANVFDTRQNPKRLKETK